MPASVAFIVAKHELHADPSCIKVGQKQALSKQDCVAAPMGEQIGHWVGFVVGVVVVNVAVGILGLSVGNSDSHPVIKEATRAACVTLTETRQALHAGPSETAVGQKQASSGQADAAN